MDNIFEGNKLIAEFVGFKKTFVRNSDGIPYDYDIPDGFELIKEAVITIEEEWGYGLEVQDMCVVSDLKFHSSWDWLIPCIDKIYSSDDYIEYLSTLGQFNDGIFINTKFIESTWESVIEFIKWYNNEKEK